MIKSQLVLNWIAITLVILGLAVSTFASPYNTTYFVLSGLLACSPFISALIAARTSGRGAIGALAIALNAITIVIFGGFTAFALTGLAGAFALFPLFLIAVIAGGFNIFILLRARCPNTRSAVPD